MSAQDDSPDAIVYYPRTVRDGVIRFCTTCQSWQYMWEGVTAGGDRIIGCGTCQGSHRRESGTPQ